jgi:uncharacterized membrane protein YadS
MTYSTILRLLLLFCIACALAGLTLALEISGLARSGYVPAVFLTALLAGLALSWGKLSLRQ